MTSRIPLALYRGLALAATVSGIGIAAGVTVENWDNMFLVLILALAVIILSISVVYGATSLCATTSGGTGAAFWVSWILGALLLVPLAVAVFVLIVARQPENLWEDWSQISNAERIALIALLIAFISLGAATVLGFVVRKQRRSNG